MKTLNDYLKLSYRMEVVKDSDEGGYVISFPELPGCLTSGETIEEAMVNADDAKKVWLEAALEDGIQIQEPESLEKYSGQFKLRMPRLLHRSLAEHYKKEGISRIRKLRTCNPSCNCCHCSYSRRCKVHFCFL